MDITPLYPLAADALLLVHFLFVVFMVLGLLLVFVGGLRSWRWVRNPWFRAAHLLGIAFVVVQSWLGEICPLTTWEMALRARAGADVYDTSFIAHWVSELLYYQFPPWVFIVCYTIFGVLVLTSWFIVRPRGFSRAA